MPTFLYEATRLDDQRLLRGTQEADTAQQVKDSLRRKGQIVQKITQQRVERKLNIDFNNLHLRPNHVSPKDLAHVYHKLASAAATGMSIPRAMEVAAAQKPKSTIAPILHDIAERVSHGQSLNNAFAAHTAALGTTTTALIKAGESSGTLDQALDRLASMMDDRRELQQTIRAAVTYPAVSFVFTMGIAYFLLTVIIPKFKQFFNTLHGHMPALTVAVVAVSNVLRDHIVLLPVLIVALVVGWVYVHRNPVLHHYFDLVTLKLPVFGSLVDGAAQSRIAGTMSTLLSSGMGIQEVLSMSADVAGNLIHQEALLLARDIMLKTGAPLSRALTTASKLHGELALAIETGEENGQTVAVLERFAHEQAQYVKALTQGLSSSLEPVLIVVMGAVVGTIVASVYINEIGLIRSIK